MTAVVSRTGEQWCCSGVCYTRMPQPPWQHAPPLLQLSEDSRCISVPAASALTPVAPDPCDGTDPLDGHSLYGEGQSWHEGKGPFEVRKGPVLKMSKDGGTCFLSGMCACA